LKAATSFPTFSSELLTDSETSKKLLFNESGEEKSSMSEDMSMESMFKENENDFKNNVTKEERHTFDQVLIDGKMVKYSSLNNNRVKVNEKEDEEEADAEGEVEETTTVLPNLKKGKYLDLMPPGDDNMNASIPNAAEVWALAAMREVDTRKPIPEDDVELLNESMNNTVKSLLDWTEIAKLDNETAVETTTNAAVTEKTYDNSVAAESKEIAVPSLAPTLKSEMENVEIELEHKDLELAGANKSLSKSDEKVARIDTEMFAKSNEQEQDEEELVELIAPVNKSKEKANLLREATTTESSEQFSTTEPLDEELATTIESVEVTTSIVDTFTAKDDPSEDLDVFKRTVTEMPEMHSTTVSPPEAETTIVMIKTTTERPNPSINEIPESTMKYNKSTMVTKSISIRIAASTTTEQPETTTEFNEETSTQAPTFMSHSQHSTEFPLHEEYDSITTTTSTSSSISPIEITDDDKFKYNTLLPETTATVDSSRAIKTGKKIDEEDIAVTHAPDALNKETAEGGNGGNTAVVVGVTVSLLVLALIAIGGFVSLFFMHSEFFF
jgi:hypothetical protein